VELDELLGAEAPGVAAEWDGSDDALGRAVVTLRLEDFAGSVTTVFDPKELESPDKMRWRLNRLWRDLLRVRAHKQFQELQRAGVLEGG